MRLTGHAPSFVRAPYQSWTLAVNDDALPVWVGWKTARDLPARAGYRRPAWPATLRASR